MISFLAGKPNPTTFPFSSISVTLKPVIPGAPSDTLVVESDALNEGLQYGPTAGLGGLVEWLEVLQEKKHHRTRDGSWRVSVGSGSQDLIYKVSCGTRSRALGATADELVVQAFQSLINEGDSVLLEAPVYS